MFGGFSMLAALGTFATSSVAAVPTQKRNVFIKNPVGALTYKIVLSGYLDQASPAGTFGGGAIQ